MTSIFGLSLPAEDFAAQFEPGSHYGNTWVEVQDLLTRSPADHAVVSALRSELRDTGRCSTLVWVQIRPGNRGMRVGSGEHHVVAALLEHADVTYYISTEELSRR